MTTISTQKLGTQTQIEKGIAAGLDFILSHLKEPKWPRTISTKATGGKQIPVYSKQETLFFYKSSNFLDCRINAYPYCTTGNIRQTIDLVMIDLDQSTFRSCAALDAALRKTLKKIKETFGDEFEPSILWSGRGYHVYLPTEARYDLEDKPEFSKFEKPSTQFLRFAEWYLSCGKADSNHYNNVSFGNCILRIPGSYNSKCVLKNNNVADSSTQVKVVKQWDGNKARAPIYLLIGSFLAYLVDQKQKEQQDQQRRRKQFSNDDYSLRTTIPWIEKLLQIAIEDYRKNAVGLILAPYLINVRKLTFDEAFTIIQKWLDKCSTGKRRLDFNSKYLIRYNLKYTANKGSRPLRLETLKDRNRELYDILVR